MVIVGALSPDDNSSHIDELRGLQPQLDVDVLVNPPRADLRRLLLRSKIYLSARGCDANSTEDAAAFTHTVAHVGTAISAGCVPVVFHIGAEAEFCEAHAAGCTFRDEDDLTGALHHAAKLADSGGLSAGQSEKMEAFSPAAHRAAWARIMSRLDPNESKPDRPPALVVTGCHRSGTSAMARVLSLAGADLPRDMMASAFDNPTGFWEPAAIAEFNDTLLASRGSSWDDMFAFSKRHSGGGADKADIQKACRLLESNYAGNRPIVLKDPRISILTGVWESALCASQYQPRFIIMVRDPREVAASLAERNGFSTGKGLLIWANYMLAADLDTRSSPRIFVAYDDLLSWPEATLDRIATSLSITFPRATSAAARASAFIAPSQRHQTIDAPWSHRLTEPIHAYFEALRAACRDEPLREASSDQLECWLAEFGSLFTPGPLEA